MCVNHYIQKFNTIQISTQVFLYVQDDLAHRPAESSLDSVEDTGKILILEDGEMITND